MTFDLLVKDQAEMDRLRQRLFIDGNIACSAKSLAIAGAESLVRMELESDSLWWQSHGRAEGFARGPLLAAERQSDHAATTRDVRTAGVPQLA